MKILSLLIAAFLLAGTTGPADSAPAFDRKWGSTGTGNGQFDVPGAVAIDGAGNVFVADRDNDRIQRFDADGTFVLAWGTSGTGNGQFDTPRGIAVDDSGSVYVADSDNNRIQKFSATGAYLYQWGSSGSGNGQFNNPRGITVDENFQVYVTEDPFNGDRVQKFTSGGAYVTQWGSTGSGNGQFQSPRDITADNQGFIYITDTLAHRVQKFTDAGAYVTQWGSLGTGNGQLNFPIGIVWTGSSLWVVEQNNHRIQEFQADGSFVQVFGSRCDLATATGCVDPDGGGPLESGDGQFDAPTGITLLAGELYITDSGNDRVVVLDAGLQIGIPDEPRSPVRFLGAFPNPARSSTRILYALPETPDRSSYALRVRIYDSAGRRIREMENGIVTAGDHQITWDGRNDAGALVPPGIYHLQIAPENGIPSSLKLVRIR
jgi:sugar lactone lactonase YvrE